MPPGLFNAALILFGYDYGISNKL